MKGINQLRILSKLSERIFEIQSLDKAHKLIADGFLECFESDSCAVYQICEKPDLFSKKYITEKVSKTDLESFPVFLKVESTLIKAQSEELIFSNNVHPCPFFINDPFIEGNIIFIPVYLNTKLELFICGKSKKKYQLKNDDFEVAKIISNIYSHALQIFNLNDLLSKNQKELSGKIYDTNRKLQNVNERLKSSNEELQQFAYLASHDLQEPLRMISNYINLFLRNYKNTLTPEGIEFLGYAQEGSERMHNMIKDLLAYARLDHADEDKTEFSGIKMLEEALLNLQVAIDESNALVFYEDLPSMFGNRPQIERLFQNLIDNGIKYKANNDPIVFISATDKKDKYEFKILDNGIGIEPKFHERIFGFFNRLHSKEKYKGSGLGLSISRKIVERHHGTIGVESQDGNGSVFYFTLGKK